MVPHDVSLLCCLTSPGSLAGQCDDLATSVGCTHAEITQTARGVLAPMGGCRWLGMRRQKRAASLMWESRFEVGASGYLASPNTAAQTQR